MLNYNSVIKNEINQESVSVKEISQVMKINLRGKRREFLTNVGKNLNMILPTEANTSSTSDKLTAIWLSPDEWMIISNELSSNCLLYTSPSPRDFEASRMPSSA